MIVENFLFRVRQWVYDNRRSLIRITLVVAAIVIAVFLIFAGVERIKEWKYEKRVRALEQQFHDAETRAREAEGRAVRLGYEIEARKAELAELQARADAADAALKTAQGKTKILKEQYETVRYVNVPADTPVSVESACRELAAIGYECK